MNEAIHRDYIIRSLQKASGGSFSVIQRALAEEAKASNSRDVDLSKVKKRIEQIRGLKVAAE